MKTSPPDVIFEFNSVLKNALGLHRSLDFLTGLMVTCQVILRFGIKLFCKGMATGLGATNCTFLTVTLS